MSASSDGGSNDEEPADDGWNMGAAWDAEVGSHSATASSSTSKLAAAVIQEVCIQQEPEFELQQHEDNVYLEWIGQQCKVGHLTTLEKVDLPVGPSTWEFEFHKGLGAVEAEDGQVLYLGDLINKKTVVHRNSFWGCVHQDCWAACMEFDNNKTSMQAWHI